MFSLQNYSCFPCDLDNICVALQTKTCKLSFQRKILIKFKNKISVAPRGFDLGVDAIPQLHAGYPR